MRRETTDALENGKEETRSPQGVEEQENLRREGTDALENPSSLKDGSLGAGSKEETRSPQGK